MPVPRAPAGTPVACPSMTDRPRLGVLDIDGVLADVRHRVHHVARRPKNWSAFFAAAVDDPPLPEGLAVAAAMVQEGLSVVYLTGRPERCRRDTVGWLARPGLPAGPLHMRRDRDHRPARQTKLEVLRRLSHDGEVAVVVDDDSAVVELLRANGFQVLHATWMDGGTEGVDTSDAQGALFEAQETDGRT